MFQAKIKNPKEISIENIKNISPEPGMAVLKVKSVGICGSDIHIYLGKNPVIKPPWVTGHEFGGTIKNVSENVDGFKIGDRVAVNPVINCGSCYYCKNDMENMCENQIIIGGTQEGALQEEVKVPINNLIKLDDSFDLLYTPIIEPLAVGVHAIGNIKDSNILIIGLGTIGLLEQQLLKLNNNRVISMDINNFSIEMSRKLNSDLAINNKDEKKNKIIQDFLGEGKIDYIVDNVCSYDTLSFSTEILRRKGQIIVVGIPANNFEIDIITMLVKELNLSTSYLYSDNDFKNAAKHILEGSIEYKTLISKVFTFDKTQEAFDYKVNNPSVKVLIEIDR